MLAFIMIGFVFIICGVTYLIVNGNTENDSMSVMNQDGLNQNQIDTDDTIDSNSQYEDKEEPSDDSNEEQSQGDSSDTGNTEDGQDADDAIIDSGETTDPSEEDSEITMVFTGDILIGNYVDSIYQTKGIKGVVSEGYLDEFEQADFVMVNEEFPFSLRGTPMENKQYTFRVKPDRVSLLHDLNVSIVSLANNHTLDYGMDAFLDTLEVLEDADIAYAGAGRNLEEAKTTKYFDVKGKNIAVLSASRVIPVTDWNATSTKGGLFTTYDPTALLQEIEEAREQADYVIVYVHWGIEKKEYPEEYQRVMGKQYIDAGADIVIGSHPHVLQGFEYYKGKPIIYSLGNFIFNPAAANTALLKVTLEGESDAKVQIIPGNTVDGYTKEYETPEDVTKAYEYLSGISYEVNVDDQGYLIDLSQD